MDLSDAIFEVSDTFSTNTKPLIQGDRYAVVRLDFMTSCAATVDLLSKKMKELCSISIKLPVEFLINRLINMIEQFQLKYVYFSGSCFALGNNVGIGENIMQNWSHSSRWS